LKKIRSSETDKIVKPQFEAISEEDEEGEEEDEDQASTATGIPAKITLDAIGEEEEEEEEECKTADPSPQQVFAAPSIYHKPVSYLPAIVSCLTLHTCMNLSICFVCYVYIGCRYR
jgi:hypothetical protein